MFHTERPTVERVRIIMFPIHFVSLIVKKDRTSAFPLLSLLFVSPQCSVISVQMR